MEFANPRYLVDTDWLEDNLANVRILDVTAMLTSKLINRAEVEVFAKSHIPGAIFFDVPSGKGCLSDPDANLPWTWPKPEDFVATMARYGIDNQTRVVIVATTPREGLDNGTMWCTRAWWTLHHFGVDCAILDGGVEKWRDEGRALTQEVTMPPAAAPFVIDDNWRRGLAGKNDVLAALASATTCVVDTLAESSFSGESAGYGARKGHITGAINVPMGRFTIAGTAKFRSAAEIHEALAASDLLATEKVVTYCGGAIAATVDAFALALFGHADVAVYDGSLMEWTADSELPMTDPSPPATSSDDTSAA